MLFAPAVYWMQIIEAEALDLLFPGQTLHQKDMAAATHIYVKDGVLHAVLEKRGGPDALGGHDDGGA